MSQDSNAKINYLLNIINSQRKPSIINNPSISSNTNRVRTKTKTRTRTSPNSKTKIKTKTMNTMKTNNRNSILTETEELFTNESQIIESFNSNCTIVDSNSDFHDKLHVYKSPIIDITKYFSPTVESQMDLELIILNEYYLKTHQHHQEQQNDEDEDEDEDDELNYFYIDAHLKYILSSLIDPMPSGYQVLDVNHSWMIYWLLNSYYLIQNPTMEINQSILDLIVNKITKCINYGDSLSGVPFDGIGGGNNQLGHLASTYAAILTLILTDQYELLDNLRELIRDWLLTLKKRSSCGSGASFIMHENGEMDARSTYCALIIINLLNLTNYEENSSSPEELDPLIDGVENWLNSCQTYEGGFSNIPNTEAHGGYTYCALASYFLLYENRKQFSSGSTSSSSRSRSNIDWEKLLEWSVHRQHELEGGVDGRTNKLVDACYGFWIGGLSPLLQLIIMNFSQGQGQQQEVKVFDEEKLRQYLLIIAQDESGGFKDKPGKQVDYYHTNYSLSGLSILEHSYKFSQDDEGRSLAFQIDVEREEEERGGGRGGDNFTNPIHPVFGIPIKFVKKCHDYFKLKPISKPKKRAEQKR